MTVYQRYQGILCSLKNCVRFNLSSPESISLVDTQILHSDKASNLCRWTKYFQAFFKANHTVQESAILCNHQKSVKTDLDELSTIKKTNKTIEHLKMVKLRKSTKSRKGYGNMEAQCCIQNSTNFSSVTGTGNITIKHTIP